MKAILSAVLLLSSIAMFAHATREVPPEIAAKIGGLHELCTGKVPVDKALIEQGKKGIFTPDGHFKCYLKCLLTEIGMMTPDDKPNYDAMPGFLPPEYREFGQRAVDACRHTTGDDPCDVIYNLNLCWYNFSPDEYFLV